MLAYNHLPQPPPTTFGFTEGVIYLEKKTAVVAKRKGPERGVNTATINISAA